MRISSFLKIERYISAVLLPLVLILLLRIPASAQDEELDPGQVGNVRWTTKSDIIVITYDLGGSPEDQYDVSITMKNENDSTFAVIPLRIEGNVGEGVNPGKDRQAEWYYRRDYPLGFSGRGYYFEMSVRKMEQHSNLIYYIAGAAALAGGIIAIIASKNQPSGPPPPGDLPYPPVRP